MHTATAVSPRRHDTEHGAQRLVVHVVSPQPPGIVGGAERHALDLAEAQLLEGTLRPIVLAPGNQEYASLVRARGVAVVEPELTWSVPALLRLRRDLGRQDSGLVHAHGYKADVAGLLLTGRAGGRCVPLVITSHGLVRAGAVVRAKSWIDMRTFRGADRVIATSCVEAERLTSVVRRGVTHIPNGVRLASDVVRSPELQARVRAQLGLAEGRLVTFVGRLAPEKRADRFVDTCALIAARVEDARFLVVGDGAERARLERRVARCGLERRLRFAGAGADVAELLSASELLLSTSDSEGTPRGVIEAMAYGAVVVGTAVGGVPELVTSGVHGVLVSDRSPAELAGEAVRLLGDERRTAALRARARERAFAEFTVERMARRVLNVYSDVAGVDLAEPPGTSQAQGRTLLRPRGRLAVPPLSPEPGPERRR